MSDILSLFRALRSKRARELGWTPEGLACPNCGVDIWKLEEGEWRCATCGALEPEEPCPGCGHGLIGDGVTTPRRCGNPQCSGID